MFQKELETLEGVDLLRTFGEADLLEAIVDVDIDEADIGTLA